MEVKELLGKTITAISGKAGDDEMILATSDGKNYKFYHSQDCCESVAIDDVIGDLSDLLGEPLLEAEEVTSNEHPADRKKEPNEYYDDSFTWTFYKLGTRKGGVTVRWFGSSNGYYSESVDFEEVR